MRTHPIVVEESPEHVCVCVQIVKGLLRTMRSALENRIRETIPDDRPILTWLVRHLACLHNHDHVGHDGCTPGERRAPQQRACVGLRSVAWVGSPRARSSHGHARRGCPVMDDQTHRRVLAVRGTTQRPDPPRANVPSAITCRSRHRQTYLRRSGFSTCEGATSHNMDRYMAVCKNTQPPECANHHKGAQRGAALASSNFCDNNP